MKILNTVHCSKKFPVHDFLLFYKTLKTDKNVQRICPKHKHYLYSILTVSVQINFQFFSKNYFFDSNFALEPKELFNIRKLLVDITLDEPVVPCKQSYAEKKKEIQRIETRREKNQARNFLREKDSILYKLGANSDRNLVYSMVLAI